MSQRSGQMTIVERVSDKVLESPLEIVEFSGLLSSNPSDVMAKLVGDYGVVYVTALTRQGCSGCEEQKPLFEALAERMMLEKSEKVRFRRVQVKYQNDDKRESWDAKRIFGHGAYPTYMVHVKSQVGPLEVYRSIYPKMEELEKQVNENLELAEFYKSEAEKL